jgi:hypothetical protein
MKARVGDRIELISMPEEPDPIPPGTRGTVQYGVKWDNGRGLSLCVPPDEFKILDQAGQA